MPLPPRGSYWDPAYYRRPGDAHDSTLRFELPRYLSRFLADESIELDYTRFPYILDAPGSFLIMLFGREILYDEYILSDVQYILDTASRAQERPILFVPIVTGSEMGNVAATFSSFSRRLLDVSGRFNGMLYPVYLEASAFQGLLFPSDIDKLRGLARDIAQYIRSDRPISRFRFTSDGFDAYRVARPDSMPAGRMPTPPAEVLSTDALWERRVAARPGLARGVESHYRRVDDRPGLDDISASPEMPRLATDVARLAYGTSSRFSEFGLPPPQARRSGLVIAAVWAGLITGIASYLLGHVDFIIDWVKNALGVGSDIRPEDLIPQGALSIGVSISMPPREWVDVAAFAPSSVRAGDTILVQVLLHTIDEADVARALAIEADNRAERHGVRTLDVLVTQGDTLTVSLHAQDCIIDEPVQTVVWRGRANAVQFLVETPVDSASSNVHFRVQFLRNSIPVGTLRFVIRMLHDEQPTSTSVLHGDAAIVHQRAFVSYSSEDRPAVTRCAQALNAAGISVRQDILSLSPGQRWEAGLYREIDDCDLVLLFWSSHAKSSIWVKKEIDYALSIQAESSGHEPDIKPVIIEGPPIPKPHDDWSDIHFNDPFYYIILGVDRENQTRPR